MINVFQQMYPSSGTQHVLSYTFTVLEEEVDELTTVEFEFQQPRDWRVIGEHRFVRKISILSGETCTCCDSTQSCKKSCIP